MNNIEKKRLSNEEEEKHERQQKQKERNLRKMRERSAEGTKRQKSNQKTKSNNKAKQRNVVITSSVEKSRANSQEGKEGFSYINRSEYITALRWFSIYLFISYLFNLLVIESI